MAWRQAGTCWVGLNDQTMIDPLVAEYFGVFDWPVHVGYWAIDPGYGQLVVQSSAVGRSNS